MPRRNALPVSVATLLAMASASLDLQATDAFGRAAPHAGVAAELHAARSADRVFWQGRNRSKAIFNFDGRIFWEGRGKSDPLANVRGDTVWKDRNAGSAILNVEKRSDGTRIAWEGRGRGTALFSIDAKGVVWEGRNRSKALANIDGTTIWNGRNKSSAIANRTGAALDDAALCAALWLLLEDR